MAKAKPRNSTTIRNSIERDTIATSKPVRANLGA
jgi:hypothetical protein